MTPLAVACIVLGLSLLAGSAIGTAIASADPEPTPPPVDHDRTRGAN